MQQTCSSWEVTVYWHLEECNHCCSTFGKSIHTFYPSSIRSPFIHQLTHTLTHSHHLPIHSSIHPSIDSACTHFLHLSPHGSSMSQGRRSNPLNLHIVSNLIDRAFSGAWVSPSHASERTRQVLPSRPNGSDNFLDASPHGSVMTQKRCSKPFDLHPFSQRFT